MIFCYFVLRLNGAYFCEWMSFPSVFRSALSHSCLSMNSLAPSSGPVNSLAPSSGPWTALLFVPDKFPLRDSTWAKANRPASRMNECGSDTLPSVSSTALAQISCCYICNGSVVGEGGQLYDKIFLWYSVASLGYSFITIRDLFHTPPPPSQYCWPYIYSSLSCPYCGRTHYIKVVKINYHLHCINKISKSV